MRTFIAMTCLAGFAISGCDSSPTEPAQSEPRSDGAASPNLQLVSLTSVPDRDLSDIAVLDGHVYTGTLACRVRCGDRLLVWSIRQGDAAPELVTSVVVDARTVNDVKVDPERRLAVISHEGSPDGLNGVTFLDLADAGAPRVIGRYTDGLEPGVHNVFIDGDVLYVAVREDFSAESPSGPLKILDISDPAAPVELATYHAGTSFIHDVFVRDGLAFVSHWNAGLVILDVGGGGAGGSPDAPVELSRIELNGETHNSWYWPARDLVFVGEEDFQTPGAVHVVDVTDLTEPREVATYRASDVDPPHNFRMDEAAGRLYIAYYGEGVRIVDVSGPLQGTLDPTEVDVASLRYAEGLRYADANTFAFGLRLAGGRIYVSDLDAGLAVLELTE